MQVDTFQYPPNRKQIKIHEAANRIGKIRNIHTTPHSINNQQIAASQERCSDCNRVFTDTPKLKWHESEQELEDRYGVYGPNCVIYLGFIKRITIFMFVATILVAVPLLVLNLEGYACQIPNYCIQADVIYDWSLYNVLGVKYGSLPHTIIWFLFCFLVIIFNLYLRKYALDTYRRINDKNVKDSDYTLLLRRLPDGTTEDHIRRLIVQEIKKINQEMPNLQPKLSDLSIRDIILIKDEDDAIKSLKTQVHYFKKAAKKRTWRSFIPAVLQKPTKFANAALVRFHDMRTSQIIAERAKTSMYQKLMNYLCVFYNKKTQYQINGINIALNKAPHPTDMDWYNFGFSERSRIIRKVIFTVYAVGILILSGVIALIISYWMELLTKYNGERPVFLTIVLVLIFLIINRIIRKLVVYMTKVERFQTRTDKKTEQINLIVINQSLNLGFFTIIVPILVQLPDYIAKNTTKSSSFPLIMFVTIVIQAIVVTLLDFGVYYFGVRQGIYKWLDNKKIKLRTHTQALSKYIGIQVPFVKCYAFNVKMVWFGLVYGIVTPISIFIVFIGMLMTYFFERVLFNSKYSIPFYSGPKINEAMIELLDWTPLFIGLVNLFLYRISQTSREFENDSRIMGLIIAMIVIGAINILVPYQRILKNLSKRKFDTVDMPYNPKNMEITFEESDPFGRKTPNILYRQANFAQNYVVILPTPSDLNFAPNINVHAQPQFTNQPLVRTARL